MLHVDCAAHAIKQKTIFLTFWFWKKNFVENIPIKFDSRVALDKINMLNFTDNDDRRKVMIIDHRILPFGSS